MSSAASWASTTCRLLIVLAALIAAACSNGGGDSLSDHPDIERVVRASEAGDLDELLGLVTLAHLACRFDTSVGAPPHCEGGESVGDVVEVLPMAGCERVYLRPGDAVSNALSGIIAEPALFYGAYDARGEGLLASDTAVVFEEHPPEHVRARALYRDEAGQITGIHFGCDGDAGAS